MADKKENLINNIKDRQSKTLIKDRNVETELRKSFMEYAMSVIVSRALPDARDGLKPVHRRILFAAHQMGLVAGSAYKKSARLVGEVIGKYHPHGDTAVYETMVRMAQDFSMRYLLVDGHGNFGSVDGDSAAAMRYTEARLSRIAMEIIRDIDKDTVDFRDNYDGTEREPSVLPSIFPNTLVNGSSGIAVGMATNIPPHNLTEIIGGILTYINNKDVAIEELAEIIKGPDFPTSASIIYSSGIKDYMLTGRGSISIRSKVDIDYLDNGKSRIIVSEIPYMVNKSNLIEKIAELVSLKHIEGISDLRDESSIKGIRIVIETKRDSVPEVVLNQLYKMTQLQTSFGCNVLSLVDGRPKLMNIKDSIQVYYNHQIDVLIRKTKFELRKAQERFHVLEGLVIAVQNIDKVIKIIRASNSVDDAQKSLETEFNLSSIQSKSITDMRLARLTGLEIEKITNELEETKKIIDKLNFILESDSEKDKIISEQLINIKEKFGDERRTEILHGISSSIDDEDLIPVEDVVITLSKKGYLKRLPIDTYRSQNRGGVGVKATTLNEDDDVDQILTTTTHTDLMFFTNAGKVYRIRAHQVHSASRQSKGIPAINIIPIEKTEKVLSILPVDSYDEGFLFFITNKGVVKKTHIKEFALVRSNGKIAITLKEGDLLFNVLKTNGSEEIFVGASNGNVCRFQEEKVRSMGRTAAGVRGMWLNEEDQIVGASSTREGTLLLSVGNKGLGKLTNFEEFRLTNRGAKGVTALKVNKKTGQLISTKLVNPDEDIMLITNTGKTIRLPVSQIRVCGRSTSGVILMDLESGQKIQSVAVVKKEDNPIDNEENKE